MGRVFQTLKKRRKESAEKKESVMFKKIILGLVIGCAVPLVAGAAFAQAAVSSPVAPPDMQGMMKLPDEEMVARMEKFRAMMKNLSPEQREAMRAKRREHMETLSPEERKAMHEKMRTRIEAMPPELRDRMRAAMGHDGREQGPIRSDRLLRFDGQNNDPRKRALPPPPPPSDDGLAMPPRHPDDAAGADSMDDHSMGHSMGRGAQDGQARRGMPSLDDDHQAPPPSAPVLPE